MTFPQADNRVLIPATDGKTGHLRRSRRPQRHVAEDVGGRVAAYDAPYHIPTYVLSVGDDAALTPRTWRGSAAATDPDTGNAEPYVANPPAELVDAFGDIRGARSCDIDINGTVDLDFRPTRRWVMNGDPLEYGTDWTWKTRTRWSRSAPPATPSSRDRQRRCRPSSLRRSRGLTEPAADRLTGEQHVQRRSMKRSPTGARPSLRQVSGDDSRRGRSRARSAAGMGASPILPPCAVRDEMPPAPRLTTSTATVRGPWRSSAEMDVAAGVLAAGRAAGPGALRVGRLKTERAVQRVEAVAGGKLVGALGAVLGEQVAVLEQSSKRSFIAFPLSSYASQGSIHSTGDASGQIPAQGAWRDDDTRAGETTQMSQFPPGADVGKRMGMEAVRESLRIARPIEEVWRAWTDPEWLAGWHDR
jgi:hypothetical protein